MSDYVCSFCPWPKAESSCPHPGADCANCTVVRSFKLGCVVRGEHGIHYNAVRLASAEECEAYGKDLYSRWTMLERWSVERSSEPVSHRMVDGRLFSLAALEGGEGVAS